MSVDVFTLADFLASILDVAFDHQAFDKLFDVRIVIPAVQDFLRNTDLLQILFAGV